MMTLISRISNTKNVFNVLLTRLHKVSGSNLVQVASINGKATRIRRPRPPPFPYLDESYSHTSGFDRMLHRFDENTKIIVVDGPIAAGKDKFARKLANELEMAYVPAPSFDDLYINSYGYDARLVNSTYPEDCQLNDIQSFLKNPQISFAAEVQFDYYLLKIDAYSNALLHLLSSGEGVVLNRSFFSDFVFMKAMHNAGYVSKKCLKYYEQCLHISTNSNQLPKPHLVIYLDVPVNIVKERIKKRNIPYEVNSKVLTTEYLTDIESYYKDEYLKNIITYSHLLIYDGTTELDMIDVVDDIEFLKFEYNANDPKKFKDWVFSHISELRSLRLYLDLIDRMQFLQTFLAPFKYDIPELMYSGENLGKISELPQNVPGLSYSKGYNIDLGEKVIWKIPSREKFELTTKLITYDELAKTSVS